VAFVRLTQEQRAELTDRLEREALNGRRLRHFQILLLANEGRTDEPIAAATGASRSTVERDRTRFAREGLEATLTDKRPERHAAQVFCFLALCSLPSVLWFRDFAILLRGRRRLWPTSLETGSMVSSLPP